jgi:hypothetical protein
VFGEVPAGAGGICRNNKIHFVISVYCNCSMLLLCHGKV